MKTKGYPIGSFALLLAAALMLGACGDRGTTTQTAGSAAPAEKVLRLTITRLPETLNPHRLMTEYELMSRISANLYTQAIDERTQTRVYFPEIAANFPEMLDTEYLIWKHTLRRGLTFEDGTPIDAYTYEYSYKMLHDPKLLNRNTGYELVNLEAYLEGECAWEDVGFEVVDAYTIIVTYTEEYCPVNVNEAMGIFGWIGSSIVHPTMYAALMNADGTETTYGTTLDRFSASGTYRVSRWIEGQYIEYEKRPAGSSPLESMFTPDRVTYNYVTETNVAIQLYENGEIDSVNASTARFNDYPGLFYTYNSSNYGVFLNPFSTTNPILQNPNFRYAIYWGIDRKTIMDTIRFADAICARMNPFITTVWDRNDTTKLVSYFDQPGVSAIRIDGHPITETGYDPALAVDYFNRAYQANGNRKITMEMQFFDGNEQSVLWAEFVQDSLQRLFGIDRIEINLQAVPWNTVYENLRRDTMNYEMLAAGGIYMNFEAPWENTNFAYTSPWTYTSQYCVQTPQAAAAWDELFIKCAIGEYKFNQAGRIEASIQMEEIMMNDMCFVPVYSGGSRVLIREHLDPILDIGHPDLGAWLWQAKWLN